jgi:uncharacterized membrane protein (UPF0127 family)
MSTAGPIAAINRTRGVLLAQNVRIANTHWTRLRGLMGTTQSAFCAGQALLIVPCHGVHTIAMRFPLDLLYLDHYSTVIHLEEDVKPWRLTSIKLRAASVLELPAGTIRSSGTRIGDKIEIATANQPEEIAA